MVRDVDCCLPLACFVSFGYVWRESSLCAWFVASFVAHLKAFGDCFGQIALRVPSCHVALFLEFGQTFVDGNLNGNLFSLAPDLQSSCALSSVFGYGQIRLGERIHEV